MTHCDRSSKDARLAFYQTADVKKLKYDDIGGFQLLDLIITELKSHMTCYNSMPLIG